MPSEEEITQQHKLLRIHRRTVQHYLEQYGKQGSYVPSGVAHDLDEARVNILRIKGILRNWGVAVDDHPHDEPSPPRRSDLAEVYANDARLGSQIAGRGSTQVRDARDVTITSSQKSPMGGVLLAIVLLIILLLVAWYLGSLPFAS